MTEQLRMIYDDSCPALPPPVLPDGFNAHPLRKDEWPKYYELRYGCGFDLWNDDKIQEFYANEAIKDGIFVIEENATGLLVASATAEYGKPKYKNTKGTLGWVMTRKGFEGKGLGRAISTVATQALFDAGLAPVYLLTDDFRVPAVALYLKMNWRPWLFQDDMPERWQKLCDMFKYPAGWLKEHAIYDLNP